MKIRWKADLKLICDENKTHLNTWKLKQNKDYEKKTKTIKTEMKYEIKWSKIKSKGIKDRAREWKRLKQ